MMKKYLFTMMVWMVAVLTGNAQNHWVPNPYQFPTNMNVVAVIEVNGFEQTNEFLEIGAFYDDECRGSMMLQYEETLDRYMLFMTLYGENGDDFTFQLYDHLSERELVLDCENEITFHSNAIVGSVLNPYVFSFAGGSCAVNVVADPPEGGTVTGGGTVPCGTPCTVTATPAEGGNFVEWHLNGAFLTTSPSYSFNALADLDFKAFFGTLSFNVSVAADPLVGGSVTGAGVYQAGETCTVTANPNASYYFDCWKEGDVVVSQSPAYSFVVHEDHDLTACFVQHWFVVTADADPQEGGVIEGAGTYLEGETCHLSVTPNEGFTFRHWIENDGVVSNDLSFSFVVTSHRAFKAVFDINPNNYLISVSANPPEGGYAVGGGAYLEGTECEVFAAPVSHYTFLNWTENGTVVSTEPSYTFTVTGDRTLVANFQHVEGVDEIEESCIVYPNPTHQWVWVKLPNDTSETHLAMPIKVYTLQGQLVLTSAENPVDLSSLAPGTYLILGRAIVKK